MSMCITVTAIQVGEGRKPCVIVTTDGAKLKCFPDKIAKWGIEVGGSYNVETEVYTSSYGQSHTITKAKRITVGSMASPPARAPFVSGLPDRPQPSAPAAPAPAFRTPEQMFVSEVICAYIAAGKCANPGDLKTTIQAIRAAYNGNWGTPNSDETGPYLNGHSHLNGNGAAPH